MSLRYEPVPDQPGWYSWAPEPDTGFHQTIAPVIVRRDGAGKGRCRMQVEDRHLILGGAMHGGAILTFIDLALFGGGYAAGADTRDSVTLDLATQFVSPAGPGLALDAEVELVRETGSLLFLRGTLVQEEGIVATFAGTLRKGRRKP